GDPRRRAGRAQRPPLGDRRLDPLRRPRRPRPVRERARAEGAAPVSMYLSNTDVHPTGDEPVEFIDPELLAVEAAGQVDEAGPPAEDDAARSARADLAPAGLGWSAAPVAPP